MIRTIQTAVAKIKERKYEKLAIAIGALAAYKTAKMLSHHLKDVAEKKDLKVQAKVDEIFIICGDHGKRPAYQGHCPFGCKVVMTASNVQRDLPWRDAPAAPVVTGETENVLTFVRTAAK